MSSIFAFAMFNYAATPDLIGQLFCLYRGVWSLIASTRHSRYHSRSVHPYFHQKFLLQSISVPKSLLICPAFLSYLYSLVEDSPDEAALRRLAIFSLDSFFQAHKTSTCQTKSRLTNRSYRNEHVAYTKPFVVHDVLHRVIVSSASSCIRNSISSDN